MDEEGDPSEDFWDRGNGDAFLVPRDDNQQKQKARVKPAARIPPVVISDHVDYEDDGVDHALQRHEHELQRRRELQRKDVQADEESARSHQHPQRHFMSSSRVSTSTPTPLERRLSGAREALERATLWKERSVAGTVSLSEQRTRANESSIQASSPPSPVQRRTRPRAASVSSQTTNPAARPDTTDTGMQSSLWIPSPARRLAAVTPAAPNHALFLRPRLRAAAMLLLSHLFPLPGLPRQGNGGYVRQPRRRRYLHPILKRVFTLDPGLLMECLAPFPLPEDDEEAGGGSSAPSSDADDEEVGVKGHARWRKAVRAARERLMPTSRILQELESEMQGGGLSVAQGMVIVRDQVLVRVLCLRKGGASEGEEGEEVGRRDVAQGFLAWFEDAAEG
ncbi:hypothetical protein HKX48_003089 [Thoreauomyces humboldtii]|nr:hypothetical protein HKX48_003089 [Thoreauomyces humboldtii]